MISRGRLLVPALLFFALTGCSFQGSVSGADSSSPARTTTSTTPSASSSTSSQTGTSPSASGPPPAGSTSTASGSGSGSAGRCHTADLTASLQQGSPGAGQRYATLTLTNAGGRSCTVTGYGGIGLVDASGAPLPTNQVRVSPPAPASQTLRPGGSVSSQLHWSAVPDSGDATGGDCQPTAAALQVIPPDETQPLSVPWTQGPVCERGTIDQQPYAAG